MLKRAKICIKKSTETEDFSLNLQEERNSVGNEYASLDPKSLIFFSQFIFENEVVEKKHIAKTAKTMFEASTAYALIFRTREDFHLCHELLKQALYNLDLMEKSLEQIIDDESLLTDFFSSNILQVLTMNLDLSREHLSDRHKIVLEFVIKVVKF